MQTRFLIGCSGYFYKDWRGKFYPDDLPQKHWLAYYARHFSTVEINNSFYRMPTASAVQGWVNNTPPGFALTLKGSRFTTHMKQLIEPEESVGRVYQMVDGLGDKLGCVLWQLPERMQVNLAKLEHFCATLQSAYRNVIEFRHASWWQEPQVRTIMNKHKVGFCILSAPDGLPDELVETTDFAYLRLHGTQRWYHHDYSAAELQSWAERLRTLQARTVYAYFNNDVNAHAVHNARTLASLLEPR